MKILNMLVSIERYEKLQFHDSSARVVVIMILVEVRELVEMWWCRRKSDKEGKTIEV